MTIRPPLTTAVCALTLTLTGCSLPADPYTTTEPDPRAAAVPSRVDRTPDGRPAGDTPPTRPELPTQAAAGAGGDARASPEAAASAYAEAAGNWSAGTLARQYDRMRALATGRLAAELDASRPDPASIRALRDTAQANRARPLAAARTPRQPAGAARVVVVTREEAVNAGTSELAGARHVVYHATLKSRPDGWRLTGWEVLP